MPRGSYHIRTMTRAEVDLAVDWAAQEGWNPGLHDADCFYSTDPQGFFIGLLDGEPIGCVSAVAYGTSYGFLGFYIVRPAYRKQGLGIRLWQEGMKHLSGRNIGLDGVLAQQDNYEKSGFRLAHRNIRFQWIVTDKKPVTEQVVELSKVPKAALAAYDTELFGVGRDRFLECWISRPGTIALGMMQKAELFGYGVLRACRRGFKIGPLFADDADCAEALFFALTADLPEGTPVFLDIPAVNSRAAGIAERYGLTKVFETARMYTRAEPQVPLHRWFGVTSFELG